jgi:hypothetical protein
MYSFHENDSRAEDGSGMRQPEIEQSGIADKTVDRFP